VGLAESNAITAPVSSPVTITWMGTGNSALPTKNSLVVLAGFEPATSKLCAGPATNKLCQGWWHIHSATVSPTFFGFADEAKKFYGCLFRMAIRQPLTRSHGKGALAVSDVASRPGSSKSFYLLTFITRQPQTPRGDFVVDIKNPEPTVTSM